MIRPAAGQLSAVIADDLEHPSVCLRPCQTSVSSI
jgi:hypothetical protein